LNPSKGDRRQVMTIGYRLFDVGIYKNVLNVRTNIGGEEGGKNVYAHEYYEVPGFKVEDDKWYNIILSGNLESRRISLMINGKRFDDIHLTSRFVTYYKRFYKERMGAYLALQFFNYGWGGVLDGYADNLVVYERGLNGAEMKELHKKYGGEFSDVTVTPTTHAFTEEEKKAYFAAVANGDLDSVQGFLNRGMPVDELWYGWTGLMLAAYYGQPGIASELIERKADVSVKVEGWDAYQLAKARNHPEVAALLNDYLNTERFYFERSVLEIKHRSILKPPPTAKKK
ncbi:MAG: ankyrin repeat domain-containing protein, partial [Leptospiraceae bacterium]|nr:ankyrin repeat domain-containing protein [Leptospiraceae bacterium]